MGDKPAKAAIMCARQAAVRLGQVVDDIVTCVDTDFPAGAVALAAELERLAADTAAKIRGAVGER